MTPVFALAGCGQATGLLARDTSPTPNCHTSPPDVLNLQTVPFGGGDQTVSTAERDAENRFLYAHWGVATDGVFGDGHYYMGFTRDAQKYLADLRRSVPDPGHVRAYCTPYSKAELGSTMDRLAADRQTLHAQGIDLVEWGEGGLDGHVDITVSHLTPEIERRLRSRYGAILGGVQQGTAGFG